MKIKSYFIFIIILLIIISFIVYFKNQSKTSEINQNQLTRYNRSIEGLNYSNPSEIIETKNNETIQLNSEIIKVNISGKEIKMFGYNGEIPGPLIKVKQGNTIYINFTNNLDQNTTIHWHGIRLDNKYDGVPEITQNSVNPAKSFLYKIYFPDAGIYWYHPHLREDIQQQLGLYGNILVEPNDTSFNKVDREEIITLSDIQITDNDITPLYKEKINQVLMGRFGNVLLINGRENYSLDVNKNEVIRFYITNTANARVFNLSFSNYKIKVVGSDGGLYEKEKWANSIIVAPSERAIIEIKFDKPGIVSLKNINPIKEYNLGTITVSNTTNTTRTNVSSFETLKLNKNKYLENYKKYLKNDPDIRLKLSIDIPGMDMSHGNPMMEGMNEDNSGIEWEDTMQSMNYASSNETIFWKIIDEKTNLSNMDINYNWKIGDKIKIRIFNDPISVHPMQHPIHFHGQRFLVLSVDGIPNDDLVWKDTVLIPSGKTVDILLDVTNPGDWMAHCHIAEHLQDGMMFTYHVE